jgi:hypothetical protein
MLAVTSYPQGYIDACRKRTDAQVAAHKLASATDHDFYANLTLLLDYYFVHRTRAMEGKDGNPLNEVRMLCNSILRNDGVLAAEKSIKYKPETSVLKLKIGDPIRLDDAQFTALSKAFFTEIQRKFR